MDFSKPVTKGVRIIPICNKCRKDTPIEMMKAGSKSVCKSCNNEDKKKYWNGLSPEEKRHRSAKRYGITVEIFNKMFEDQSGKCAICETTLVIPDKNTRPANRVCIDHNHETGEVRGLLCAPCNSALGMFKDSTEIINSAIRYLGKKNVKP